MNKRGIAYIHMVEPRAKGKEGAASPIAEFANEHRDETLDVRPGLAACCLSHMLLMKYIVTHAFPAFQSPSAPMVLSHAPAARPGGSCQQTSLVTTHGSCERSLLPRAQ
jgi:hypothetical protein